MAKLKTNEQVIAELMKFGNPLQQLIVVQALLYYTQQCIEAGPDRFNSAMMHGAAWVDCCKQINAKLTAHLNSPATADREEE